jgi:hypothetical protein
MDGIIVVLLILCADITVKVDAPAGTTVTLTITVPATTNAEPSVVQTATLSPPMPQDARSSLPRSIPMPPMPPPRNTKVGLVTFSRPLPDGTNRAYSEHVATMNERALKGKRRNE